MLRSAIARVGSYLAVAALGLSALAGCSSTGALPPAPATASSQDYAYIIGPGDMVNIIVWQIGRAHV